MAAVAGLAEIEAALAELETWPGEPLVCRLARQPGRREERYAHRLCGEPAAPVRAAAIPAAPQPPVPALTPTPDDERLAALKTEIADLRAEVDALKRQLADFVSQFQ
jgi:uncharacterized protein YceH (UPF0502 family)